MDRTTAALADLNASMHSLASMRQQALDSVNLALRRFEALASPPRHLQFPLVGDLDAVVRAERNAIARGDYARAEELADLCEREVERRERLLLWRKGEYRRSRGAWQALANRLATAIDWATRTGAIRGDELVHADDYRRECLAQVRHADSIAFLDSLS